MLHKFTVILLLVNIYSKFNSQYPDAISCANSHFALLYIRAVDASVWYCQIWTENRCVIFKATDGSYSGSLGESGTIKHV
jgi:hypothetical protein